MNYCKITKCCFANILILTPIYITLIIIFFFNDDTSIYELSAKNFNRNSTRFNQLFNITQLNYIINGSTICNKSPLQLLVLIPSNPNNRPRRRDIRATWGRPLANNKNTSIAFLIGVSSKNSLKAKVIKEAEQFQDLIFINFEDTYRNLSLKTVLMMRWIRDFCSHTEFVLKVDDDMLVNVDNLANYIDDLDPNNSSFYGMLAQHAKPIRKTKIKHYLKWVASVEEYPHDVYPAYVTGGSYLFSTVGISQLVDVCVTMPYFFLEDVFVTGVCAEASNMSRQHSNKFLNYSFKYDNCTLFNIVSGHGFQGKKLMKMWNWLNDVSMSEYCSSNNNSIS